MAVFSCKRSFKCSVVTVYVAALNKIKGLLQKKGGMDTGWANRLSRTLHPLSSFIRASGLFCRRVGGAHFLKIWAILTWLLFRFIDFSVYSSKPPRAQFNISEE